MKGFERELEALINKCCQENGSDTPDFILAEYLRRCLNAFNTAVNLRSDWYGHRDRPGRINPSKPPSPDSNRKQP